MLRSRFFPILFGAGLVLAAACSDAADPTAPSASPSRPLTPPQQALVTLTGSVQLTGMTLNEVVLNTIDGGQIPLVGANASLLVSLNNAGVEVHGTWTDATTFDVADFLVNTVDGATVLDGTLIAMYDVPTDTGEPIGYAIRPTRGGAAVALTDPSTDLIAHLGQRIWVSRSTDGPPAAFGVISEQ